MAYFKPFLIFTKKGHLLGVPSGHTIIDHSELPILQVIFKKCIKNGNKLITFLQMCHTCHKLMCLCSYDFTP